MKNTKTPFVVFISENAIQQMVKVSVVVFDRFIDNAISSLGDDEKPFLSNVITAIVQSIFRGADIR